MKRILIIIGQFFSFFIADAAGSLLFHPFNMQTVLSADPLAPRSFIWDGLILMLLVYLLVVVIAVLRKRVHLSVPWATGALALAGGAGYLLKLGFVTHNW